MMAEGIHDAPHSPAVLFGNWMHLRCTSGYGTCENSVGILDGQDYTHRAATKRFRTEIAMFRGFVAYPEFRACDGKSGHHASVGVFEAKDFRGAECGLIELDGASAITHTKPGSYRARGSVCCCGR